MIHPVKGTLVQVTRYSVVEICFAEDSSKGCSHNFLDLPFHSLACPALPSHATMSEPRLLFHFVPFLQCQKVFNGSAI